jgi:hypothetical protein
MGVFKVRFEGGTIAISAGNGNQGDEITLNLWCALKSAGAPHPPVDRFLRNPPTTPFKVGLGDSRSTINHHFYRFKVTEANYYPVIFVVYGGVA